MNKRLYVGGVAYSSTEDSLRDVFSEVGDVVSVKVITDRDTGRSKGFAFIEMGSTEDMTNAIDQLNGQNVDGRTLTVSEARPPEARRDSGSMQGQRW